MFFKYLYPLHMHPVNLLYCIKQHFAIHLVKITRILSARQNIIHSPVPCCLSSGPLRGAHASLTLTRPRAQSPRGRREEARAKQGSGFILILEPPSPHERHTKEGRKKREGNGREKDSNGYKLSPIPLMGALLPQPNISMNLSHY